MAKSAIAKRPERPPTPAERLHKLDPDLAELFDRWEADLDREYDLAFNQNPAPPILDAEVALAVEGWNLAETAGRLYMAVEDLQATGDVAMATLARIALDDMEPIAIPQQRELLPPNGDDDGLGGLRAIHQDHMATLPTVELERLPHTPDTALVETRALADPPRRKVRTRYGWRETLFTLGFASVTLGGFAMLILKAVW